MVDVVRARRIAAIALLALAPGCSREPGEQEAAARKAREAAILEASQEEERRKDRARFAAAAKAAEAESDAIRAPAAVAAGEPAKPTITMLDNVHPVQTTDEQVIAQATARVEMALANPQSMLVRSTQLREQSTVVCLEVNSRDASGSYTGFVPVIVTPRQVFVRKNIGGSREVADVSASLDFDRLNERYRCF